MFTLQILGLGELRSSIVQLLPLSNIANLRCSKFSVSLTVSYSDESHFLVAAFQMFDPFFTIFSARDGNYNLNIDLQELSQIILEDDLFLTILVPSVVSSASLISLTRDGEFRSLALLGAMPPQDMTVSKFDLNLFVAVDAAKLREIATRLSDQNGTIFATASTSQVIFYEKTRTGEITGVTVLTAQRRECLGGGFDDRVDEINFSFALKPKAFFHGALGVTKLVWFFKSTRWNTTMVCFTREWSNIVACYPRYNYVSSLLNSFTLDRIRRRSSKLKSLMPGYLWK
ncbi:uncharacterized protein LOC111779246 [Cucurbita pepo subsp. pepo]|uniref:uncharacterized protein LOC111779246 n=1 Tax=Cucurbita pepo subsp. pepo TaxID=3664 RepID=UPI000C9D6E34|nr:uncharacterized protein LOC111779246 [Cucurbita pepo subsp. pepo]